MTAYQRERDLLNIIAIGSSMREAQVAYFKSRRQFDLARSKVLEQAFDKAAERALKPETDFFGGPDERF